MGDLINTLALPFRGKIGIDGVAVVVAADAAFQAKFFFQAAFAGNARAAALPS